MRDIIRESPYYQEIWKEALEEGIEEGREEERREHIAALHQTVIDIVLERFPKLVRFTRKQLVFADDPAILRHLIVKLSISKTAEEARQYLQEVDEEEEED